MIDWPDPAIQYSNKPGSVSLEIRKINDLMKRGKWEKVKGRDEIRQIVADLNNLPY